MKLLALTLAASALGGQVAVAQEPASIQAESGFKTVSPTVFGASEFEAYDQNLAKKTSYLSNFEARTSTPFVDALWISEQDLYDFEAGEMGVGEVFAGVMVAILAVSLAGDLGAT